MSENGLELPGKNEKSIGDQPENRAPEADIRSASYLILVIAAIFVINAMETGSYRTPWPVAIGVTVAGLGLLAYSFIKAKRE